MSSESRRRLVCRCMGVASPRLFAAARDEALTDVAAVIKSVRAGGGCSLCHLEIEEILADVRGDAFDPALSIENEMVCRQETLARIEGILASRIVPRLAARGARVVELQVEGLDVVVRITGSAEPGLSQLVDRVIRDAVCDDLEVRVESTPRDAAERSS